MEPFINEATRSNYDYLVKESDDLYEESKFFDAFHGLPAYDYTGLPMSVCHRAGCENGDQRNFQNALVKDVINSVRTGKGFWCDISDVNGFSVCPGVWGFGHGLFSKEETLVYPMPLNYFEYPESGVHTHRRDNHTTQNVLKLLFALRDEMHWFEDDDVFGVHELLRDRLHIPEHKPIPPVFIRPLPELTTVDQPASPQSFHDFEGILQRIATSYFINNSKGFVFRARIRKEIVRRRQELRLIGKALECRGFYGDGLRSLIAGFMPAMTEAYAYNLPSTWANEESITAGVDVRDQAVVLRRNPEFHWPVGGLPRFYPPLEDGSIEIHGHPSEAPPVFTLGVDGEFHGI